MKKTALLASFWILAFVLAGCTDGMGDALSESSDGGGNGQGNLSGIITAGEWNDLENWMFFDGLMDGDFGSMKNRWGIYPQHRISVEVRFEDLALQNVQVELKHNDQTVWEAYTDMKGKAEMWASIFTEDQQLDMSEFKLWIDGTEMPDTPLTFIQGINTFQMAEKTVPNADVDLAFIVDATGSMGDELEFLKDDLRSVILDVRADHPDLQIRTGSIFYRDEGDDYLTRRSQFTSDLNTTVRFIQNQSANGGGDFPEAVHTAVNEAVNLNWNDQARTRIAFLLLDAPPHEEMQVLNTYRKAIKKGASKGIKIIPIVASGIDKPTEFLMRFSAILSNGTYVFITNDSGVGNDHIAPTVGQYDVEYLKDLMVRVIGEEVER